MSGRGPGLVPVAAKPASKLLECAAVLGSEIDDLRSALIGLGDLLVPVLGQMAAVGIGDGEAEAGLCPLEEQLHESIRQLRALKAQVNDLRNRLRV